MLPSVDLSYGYVRLQDAQTISLPLIGAVPLGSTGIYSTDIKAKQVLFTGGALYNSYLIAQNDKLSAEFDREKFIRDLKLLVIDTYYGVIKARQQRESAKSNVASVKSHLDVAKAFFNQGMIPKMICWRPR